MANLKSFKHDPHWIARRLRPHVSLSHIRTALNDLLQLKLIPNQESDLKQNLKQVRSTRNVVNTDIRQIQSQLIENASIALNDQPLDQREIGTFVAATSLSKLKMAKTRIEAFRLEIGALLQDENPDVVVAFNTQLFCLSSLVQENQTEAKNTNHHAIRKGANHEHNLD